MNYMWQGSLMYVPEANFLFDFVKMHQSKLKTTLVILMYNTLSNFLLIKSYGQLKLDLCSRFGCLQYDIAVDPLRTFPNSKLKIHTLISIYWRIDEIDLYNWLLVMSCLWDSICVNSFDVRDVKFDWLFSMFITCNPRNYFWSI